MCVCVDSCTLIVDYDTNGVSVEEEAVDDGSADVRDAARDADHLLLIVAIRDPPPRPHQALQSPLILPPVDSSAAQQHPPELLYLRPLGLLRPRNPHPAAAIALPALFPFLLITMIARLSLTRRSAALLRRPALSVRDPPFCPVVERE